MMIAYCHCGSHAQVQIALDHRQSPLLSYDVILRIEDKAKCQWKELLCLEMLVALKFGSHENDV